MYTLFLYIYVYVYRHLHTLLALQALVLWYERT